VRYKYPKVVAMGRMPRARNGGKTQVTVLLEDEWIERLDSVAEHLSEPGVPITRAHVLRLAIRRGLEALEQEGAAKAKKK
jgi:hypothetical protein